MLLGITFKLRSYLQGLSSLRSAHNLCMGGFSLMVFVYTTKLMLDDRHFDSLEIMSCKRLTHEHFQVISFMFLLSKIWEWFDSVLLVLKGNQLRSLHIIHHATTFSLYAVDHIFLSSIKYGVSVNALVHFVMYSHYYKPFPKQYRKLITQLQILQFLASIFLHSGIYFYDCDPTIHSHFYEYITPYLLVVSYLVLFINFYITQYVFGSKTKKKTN